MTALVLGATIAARWFVARRGLVVGILTASVATGQLVFLPLLASLTDRFGWRIALALVCVMLGVCGVRWCCWSCATGRAMSACARSATRARSRCRAPPPNNAPIMAAALGTLRDAAEIAGVLDPVRHLLHLRRQHQRPDPGAPDPDVPRFRHSAGAGRKPARRHGHLRFLRHHRLGLAVGPLRQPLAVVLVLRPARAVAAVPAVHRFLVLRPVAVCDVLRPRLDRHRAADGAAHRAALRRRSAPIWCSAGSSPAISSAPATAAFGAGLSRTVLATYLPAFFVAGALCVVAALITLAISRTKPVVA